ncbi:hypothetical protein vseg_000195 [Gypsophila vaccaria]
MVPCTTTSPATILVGISLDVDVAKELLTWAINILSHPHDTIIALHVLVGKEPKKLIPRSRDYNRFRRAKSFVLSVMGEFAEDIQSKQVHLEARVSYSASIGNGLMDEAKRANAEFLLLKGSKIVPNGETTGEITKYCKKRAPKGCSIISIAQLTSDQLLNDPTSKTTLLEKTSPRTVLCNGVDGSSSDDSSINSESPPSPPPATAATKCKESPLRRVASFFLRGSQSGRRRVSESYCNEVDKLQQPLLKCFSFDEISLATKEFHPDNMIGEGGYSEVYKGEDCEGTKIAVKRLTKDNTNPNKEKEFLMELGILSQVSHPNTATLLGYCIEHGFYLIFPLSPFGNLFNALHGNGSKGLEWGKRYKIAIGVAKGLHYLHKRCKHRIIHRDIKASNVLLGPYYEPQITDFGLAKWVPASKSKQHAVLPIEGTFGYLAPEYFMHGIVDEMTDVFAFGILLLELVTGQRPINSSKQSLLLWAMPIMECGNTSELVDPRLEGVYDLDQLHKIVLTASCCVRHSSALRPSMTEVLDLLTNDQDSELVKRWSEQKSSTTNEMDDYSMVFGYNVPIDNDLEKAVAELELNLE